MYLRFRKRKKLGIHLSWIYKSGTEGMFDGGINLKLV